PGIVQRALEHLERGAKRAGRRVEDLEVIWAARTATAATTAGARRLARPTAVHWGVLRWGGYWLEPAGIRLPKLEIPEAVHTIYPDLSHARDWEAAIDATSFVSDEVVAQLCDALGLIGAPGDCAGRIAEMAKLGVRNLYLMPTLTFGPPEQEIAAFRDVVFPRLHRLCTADTVWGIAALLWLATGLARAFGGLEKGSAFYLASPLFWLKITLFATVALLEAWPMATFIRWRRALRRGEAPDTSA